MPVIHMTETQGKSLLRAIEAKGDWIRAKSDAERVVLACLWRKGLLERQAWRVVEGSARANYEYRAPELVLSSFRNNV